jgi:mannose PTS system EIIA component
LSGAWLVLATAAAHNGFNKVLAVAKLIVVAHTPLASALMAVARHTFPDCSANLVALDVDPGSGLEQVEAELAAAAHGLSEPSGGADPELLVLVDVFGATPANAALRFAEHSRARVVAGVNVPMLWRVLCYADEPLDCLVTRATEGAVQGVLQVSPPRRQNQAQPPSAHGQDHAAHQQ